MSEITDLDKRLSVLETKFSSTDEMVDKLEGKIDDTTQLILEIKERLDKMNGWVPHLLESMEQLQAQQIKVLQNCATMSCRTPAKEEKTETDVKLKIIWGGLGATFAALLGVIPYIFEHLFLK